MEFLEFLFQVRRSCGVPDVGVDFAFRGDADAHRLEFDVPYVGRDNHAPARDFGADQFRRETFAPGHVFHLFRHHALPRVMHLGHDGARAFPDPLTPQWLQHVTLPFFKYRNGADYWMRVGPDGGSWEGLPSRRLRPANPSSSPCQYSIRTSPCFQHRRAS